MSTPIQRSSELFPTLTNPLALNFPVSGRAFGQSHWDEVDFTLTLTNPATLIDEDEQIHGFVDRSLISPKRKWTYIYASKDSVEHYFIAVSVLIATPFYIVGTIVYNVLRILPVIAYLMGRLCYNLAHRQNDETKCSIVGRHFKAMGVQTWLSFANIIRTFYYAIGFLVGVLYSLVDPLNGRKIAASFELAWNHNIEKCRSYWSVMGAQKKFLFEGGSCEKGWAPEDLGHHAYFLPGCYQPIAIANYDDQGTITSISTLSGNHTALPQQFISHAEQCHVMPIGCCIC